MESPSNCQPALSGDRSENEAFVELVTSPLEADSEMEMFDMKISLPEFHSEFPERLDCLCKELSQPDRDVLMRLKQDICQLHRADINTWMETYQSALQSHVEALCKTYNSQLRLLEEQSFKEQEKALRLQYDELTATYHENLEVLQHELEELEHRTGLTHDELEDKIREEVQADYEKEIKKLQAELLSVTRGMSEVESHNVTHDISEMENHTVMEPKDENGGMSYMDEYKAVTCDIDDTCHTGHRGDVTADGDDSKDMNDTCHNSDRCDVVFENCDIQEMFELQNGSDTGGLEADKSDTYSMDEQSDVGLRIDREADMNDTCQSSQPESGSEPGTLDHSQHLITELQREIEAYRAEIERCKEQMSKIHQEEIKQMQQDHEEEMNEIRERYEALLNSKHQTEDMKVNGEGPTESPHHSSDTELSPVHDKSQLDMQHKWEQILEYVQRRLVELNKKCQPYLKKEHNIEEPCVVGSSDPYEIEFREEDEIEFDEEHEAELNEEQRSLLNEEQEKHETEPGEKEEKVSKQIVSEETLAAHLEQLETMITKMKEEYSKELEELQARLTTYESKAQELEAAQDMAEYTTSLNTRSLEEEIDRLTDELDEKEAECNRMCQELEAALQVIKEKDGIIETTRQEVTKKQQELEEKQQRLQEKEHELEEKERNVVDHELESRSKESLVKDLDDLTELLTAKDQEIINLRKKVSQSVSLADEVEKLIYEITERDEELKQLRSDWVQKEAKVTQLTTLIQEKDTQIEKMRLQLVQTAEANDTLERPTVLVNLPSSDIQHVSSEGRLTEVVDVFTQTECILSDFSMQTETFEQQKPMAEGEMSKIEQPADMKEVNHELERRLLAELNLLQTGNAPVEKQSHVIHQIVTSSLCVQCINNVWDLLLKEKSGDKLPAEDVTEVSLEQLDATPFTKGSKEELTLEADSAADETEKDDEMVNWLKESHEQELKQLENRYKKQLEDLKSKYEEQLKQLENSSQEQLEEELAAHEDICKQQLKQLKDSQNKEIEELEDCYKLKLKQLQDSCKQQLQQQQELIDSFDIERDELFEKIDNYEKRLLDYDSQLREVNKTSDEYKMKIEQLELKIEECCTQISEHEKKSEEYEKTIEEYKKKMAQYQVKSDDNGEVSKDTEWSQQRDCGLKSNDLEVEIEQSELTLEKDSRPKDESPETEQEVSDLKREESEPEYEDSGSTNASSDVKDRDLERKTEDSVGDEGSEKKIEDFETRNEDYEEDFEAESADSELQSEEEKEACDKAVEEEECSLRIEHDEFEMDLSGVDSINDNILTFKQSSEKGHPLSNWNLESNETTTQIVNGQLADMERLQCELEEAQADKEKYIRQAEELHEKLIAYEKRLEELEEENKEKHTQIEMYKQMTEDFEDQLHQQKASYEDLLDRQSRQPDTTDGLVTDLQADVQVITEQRDSITANHDHFLKMLSECVKFNMTTEEKINQWLTDIVSDRGDRNGHATKDQLSAGHRSEAVRQNCHSYHSANGRRNNDVSLSDESMDLSEDMSDDVIVLPELHTDGEQLVRDTNDRLHSAVERLLVLVSDTTNALSVCEQTQRDLASALAHKTEQLDQLNMRQADIEQRLNEEQKAKEYLASELNKAEGLLRGYQSEQADMKKRIQCLEDERDVLVSRSDCLQARVNELELAESELSAKKQQIEQQQVTLRKNVGQEEQADLNTLKPSDQEHKGQALLEENSRLNEEKRQLERLSSVKTEQLLAQISELQERCDDMQTKHERAVEALMQDNAQLQSQIESMDKQLKSDRHFLEEQTLEREQEREENQKALEKLQQSLKDKEKALSCEKRLHTEIQELEDQLHEKTDAYTQLALVKQQLESDLRRSEVTNLDLRDMIRTLELELEARTKGENDARKRIAQLEDELCRFADGRGDVIHMTKSHNADQRDTEHLEDKIRYLESEIESLKTSEQLAWQKKKQIEDELKNLKTLEDELTHDKQTLQDKVCEQLQQISSLRVQVDELKLSVYSADEKQECENTVQHLQEQLDTERDNLNRKLTEIDELSKQLDQFHEQLLERDEEIQQLTLQLTVSNNEKDNMKRELEAKLAEVQQENTRIQDQLSKIASQMSGTQMSVLAQTLIDEKNNEIDNLNKVIAELKDQLSDDHDKETEEHTDLLETKLQKKDAELGLAKDNLAEFGKIVEKICLEQVDKLSIINKKLIEKEDVLLKLTKDTSTLKRGIETLGNIKANLDEDNKCLKLLVEEKVNKIASLTTEIDEMKHKYSSAVDTKIEYKREIERLREQIMERDTEMKYKADTVKQLEENLEQLEIRKQQLEQSKTDLEEKLIDGKTDETLKSIIETQEGVIKSLQTELNRSEERMRSIQIQLDDAKKAIEKEQEQHQAETEQLKVALVRMEKEIQTLSETTPADIKQKLAEEHQRHINEVIKAAELDRIKKIEEMEENFTQQLTALEKRLTAEKQAALQQQKHELKRKQKAEGQQNRDQTQDNHSDLVGEDESLAEWTKEIENKTGPGQGHHLQNVTSAELQEILAKLHQEGVGVLSLSNVNLLRTLVRNQADSSQCTDTESALKAECANLHATIRSLQQLILDMQKTNDTNKETVLKKSLEMLVKADRQSFLSEIRELNSKHKQNLNNQLGELEDEYRSRERQLTKKVRLLEYKLDQYRVLVDDLELSLSSERSRYTELVSELSLERARCAELGAEVNRLRDKLERIKNDMELEQETLKSASSLIEDERNKANNLTEALIKEQHNAECYIEQLEKERFQNIQLQNSTGLIIQDFMKEQDKLLLEKLKNDLQNEKKQYLKVSSELNEKSIMLTMTQGDLDLERQKHKTLEKQLRNKIADLEIQLDIERAKNSELNSCLQRERECMDKGRDSLCDRTTSVQRDNQKLRRMKEETEQREILLQYKLQQEQINTKHLQHTVRCLQDQIEELTKELEHLGETFTRQQNSGVDRQLSGRRQLRPAWVSQTVDGHSEEIPNSADRSQCLQDERTKTQKLKTQASKLENDVSKLTEMLYTTEKQLETNEKHQKISNEQHQVTNNQLQAVYSKYLRAESFRKALIYQKKYLLVLLGGYQDTEQATLDTLSKMGAFPLTGRSAHLLAHRTNPYRRFRCVARVIIAIHRMKTIVKKWKNATLKWDKGGSVYLPDTNHRCSTSQGTSHILTHFPHSQHSIPPSTTTVPPPPGSAHHTESHAYQQTGYAYQPMKSTYQQSSPYQSRTNTHSSKFSDLQSHVDPSYRRPIRSAFDAMPEPAPTPPPSLDGDTSNVVRGSTPVVIDPARAVPNAAHHVTGSSHLPEDDVTSQPTDAEQALNDYIQRLETLQTRLGSVTPKSTPNYRT